MNAENVILAGIWQDPIKPPMRLTLPPVLDKIQYIKTHGIPVHTPGGQKTVSVLTTSCSFDLPAKAMASNVTQYNGYYSCTYCLDRGQHESGCHLFFAEEEYEPRTQHHVEDSDREAEASETTVYGVKGKSVLSSQIDLTESVAINYMHAALESITESLLSPCLDSKFYTHRFIWEHLAHGKLTSI